MIKQEYNALRHALAPGTLTEKLDWLRGHSEARSPDPRLKSWGIKHLDLTTSAALDWAARAWWGIAAGELTRVYLHDQTRRTEALALLDAPDWTPIEHALQFGGVILVASHLGPPRFGMNALLDRPGQHMILTATKGVPEFLPKTCSAQFLDPIIQDRSELLLRMAFHLRQGGLLYGAPDGGYSDKLIKLRDFHNDWSLSPGLAALARTLKRPSFTTHTLWEGNRIYLRIQQIKELDDSLPAEAWHHTWIRSHWDHMRKVICSSPENLQFLCGKFRKEMGSDLASLSGSH